MQISFPALQPLLFLASNEIVRTVQVVKVRAAGKKGKKWEKNVKQKVLLCTVWYKRIRLQIQSQIYPKVPKVSKSTYRAKSCLNYQMYQVFKMLSKVYKGTKSTKVPQGTDFRKYSCTHMKINIVACHHHERVIAKPQTNGCNIMTLTVVSTTSCFEATPSLFQSKTKRVSRRRFSILTEIGNYLLVWEIFWV